MPDFKFSDLHVSEADVKKVLSSPEGKKLLQLLNRDGGTRLRQAADALKSGNTDAAQQILAPVMNTQEATTLLRKLNRE